MESWRIRPHPKLAGAFAAIEPDEGPAARRRRFQALFEMHPNHDETQFMKAELALVDEKEISTIEGFDEETAHELQERAREYIAKQESELDDKRKELGVADEVAEVPGVTTAMLVKLGENGVKTVEDLAGCATDDLTGWTERKDGETKHEPGYLEGLGVSREEAETMIMQARLKAGWVTEAELAPKVSEEAPVEAPAEQA